MIDPHVHLRDWSQSAKETLQHGFEVALSVGIDEVCDMPNTDPPLTTAKAILRRLEQAKALGLPISYHVWAGVTSDPVQIRTVAQLASEWFPDIIGLKFFAGHSTGNMGLTDEQTQRQVYRSLAEAGYTGLVALHCEKESLLRPDLYSSNDFSTHSLARPEIAETASVEDQLRLSEEEGFAGHLHICHVSCVKTIDLIEKAKRGGRKVSCAVTPHHVLLNNMDAKIRSNYAKVNPPLRSEETRAALFEALLAGRVDWIETDHAPHTIQDKENGASGLPGFSGLLLLVKALKERGMSDKQLATLLGGNFLRIAGREEQDIFIPSLVGLDDLSDLAATFYPYDGFSRLRLR